MAYVNTVHFLTILVKLFLISLEIKFADFNKSPSPTPTQSQS